MSLRFIDIVEVNRQNDEPRGSCFATEDSAHPDALVVIGNLPHGYAFRPKTSADRDLMGRWLHSLKYED
jgi:hypothetical protein